MYQVFVKLAWAAGALAVGEALKAGVEHAEKSGKEVPGWLSRLPGQIEEHTPLVVGALVEKGPEVRDAYRSERSSE